MQTRTYTASSAIIANPERGFDQRQDTHFYSDNTGYDALSTSWLVQNRDNNKRTVVHRNFYMDKYRTWFSIESSYLNRIRTDLQTIRDANMKAIVRFSYTSNWNGNNNNGPYNADPPLATVLNHISQLALIVNEFKDIIFGVEKGFIGVWGENFFTDNYASNNVPTNVTPSDWAERRQILEALLDATDENIWIFLRYVGLIDNMYDLLPAQDPRLARIGFHNDAFVSGWWDMGTFANYTSFKGRSEQQYRAYMKTLTDAGHPIGGESAAYESGTSDWPNASSELQHFRYTTLNPQYYEQTIAAWGSNVNEAARRLGYRLALTEATLPASGARNSSVDITLKINNTGYSQPVNARPVYLVFTHSQSGTQHRAQITYDVRNLQPAQTTTVTRSITLPPNSGTWNMSLWLPDRATSLQSNPWYSIQLANNSTWNSTTGMNNLQASVTVS